MTRRKTTLGATRRCIGVGLAAGIALSCRSSVETDDTQDVSSGTGTSSVGPVSAAFGTSTSSTAADSSGASATSPTTGTSGATPTTTSTSTGPNCFYTDISCNIECSLEQEGCSAGEKCAPWANDAGPVRNATKCVEVEASPDSVGGVCSVVGHPTSGVDSCDVGLVCFGVNPVTEEGRCVELCSEQHGSCATSGTRCIVAIDDLFGLCLQDCDPLDPACDSAYGCYLQTPGEFACSPNGSGVGGTYAHACLWQSDCAPGRACVDAAQVPSCIGSTSCCTDFCDPAAGQACPDEVFGQTCVPFDEAPQIGLCRVMGS